MSLPTEFQEFSAMFTEGEVAQMGDSLPTEYQEFCALFAKGEVERKLLFKIFQFGIKEKERYRVKAHKQYLRQKEEREKRIQNGQEERKKVGRPRKHPLPTPNQPSQ